MRLLRGRDFTEADARDATAVAIVNGAMADRFWPKLDAIGRQFTIPGNPGQTLQIVGVVDNSRRTDPDGPMPMAFFVPAKQHYADFMTLQVRAVGRPDAPLHSGAAGNQGGSRGSAAV